MLESYLYANGIHFDSDFQGNSSQFPAEPILLSHFARSHNVKEIMEIGFNAGHSACTMLSANPTAHLTSFDLGEVAAVPVAKSYVDSTFPGRHTLILGDSRKTVVSYNKENPDKKFDLIFIDGGHTYDVAKLDIVHSSALAHKDTIVVVDDIIYVPGWDASWTLAPTRAWMEGKVAGEIHELGRIADRHGIGLVWGKYLKSFNGTWQSL
uniref:Methyltransferase n=1 Tax=viral metagenome TaxID=1070528 RepID=A0A6C0L5X7_9ZZZZ